MSLKYRRIYIHDAAMLDENASIDISYISAETFLEMILDDLAKENTRRIILEVEKE